MSGHGTDDLDKFVDRMGVRQISLPCDHGTRGDLWEEFPLNEQVRPPVSCRTGDRYRVSQPVKGHDSGICSEIAGECDLELIEVFSEPVCDLTLDSGALREDQRFPEEILLCDEFFPGERIVRAHPDDPVVTFRDPDVVETFRIHRFQEHSDVHETFFHHLVDRIRRGGVDRDLYERIFFTADFADFCQDLDGCEFPAADRDAAVDDFLGPFQLLQSPLFEIQHFESAAL